MKKRVAFFSFTCCVVFSWRECALHKVEMGGSEREARVSAAVDCEEAGDVFFSRTCCVVFSWRECALHKVEMECSEREARGSRL